MSSYDHIIIGAGASGLLLADALGRDDFFNDKKILLLDKDTKRKNDRTWCFWEKGEGAFDAIVHKTWPKIYFAGKETALHQAIAPYQYKMLRGVDFYHHYLEKIKGYANVTFRNDEILSVEETAESVRVNGKNESYLGKVVFDSRFDYKKLKEQQKYPVLQQHFLGWFVKTERPVFHIDEATFMDFSIPQKGNTRFMYVLPFSETEALVEYTLFSENVLPREEYEAAIATYLDELKTGPYEIIEVEQGNIPMSSYAFWSESTNKVIKIGIAGGWAKPSTGYAFYNSAKKVEKLVNYLKRGKSVSEFQRKNRFWFYDLLLLDILSRNNSLGQKIFESLFKKRNPQLILKFLGEDTSLFEDVKIIMACPKRPFLGALVKRLF
ncbi:lycopene cyclase family protein [Allomuricauda sp. SCSIO 65647]|uniref:lycopene cyclase family protein n=1 Tax=Allomuricauda sp. SCSIO 65647 TaxID=2908843 RepID=UPI001F28AB90|nr:lycopene cyclase family protein [Muricauda sp. SCSIO 65647]UJH68843.1 lycopene cyclase family protein [Muricauda sp. SCSIO 65647]